MKSTITGFQLSPELQYTLAANLLQDNVRQTTDWNVISRALEYAFDKLAYDESAFAEMFPGVEWKGNFDKSSYGVLDKGWKFYANDKSREAAWEAVSICLRRDIESLFNILRHEGGDVMKLMMEIYDGANPKNYVL